MGSETRLAALRRKLAGSADAFVSTNPANVLFLTGFLGVFDEEPSSLVLLTADGQWVVTDSRYAQAVGTSADGTPWQVVIGTSDLATTCSGILKSTGSERVAVDTTMSHRRWRRFEDVLDMKVVEANGWVEELRAIKDVGEVAAITAAQELTERALEHILCGRVREGATEREIALELEMFMRRQGSDGVAFPPIVASGPHSALPHSRPADRALVRGDFVVLDFGARIDGYCADMTRTVVIGAASDRQREIYDVVLAANAAGTAAVRAGASGREIDAAAREIIVAAGFGENFGHGLGHGVGLEVHELPSVGPRSEDPVLLDSVITIEPGIYVPEYGGVRIEDLVVVEAAVGRVLTRSAKDRIEL